MSNVLYIVRHGHRDKSAGKEADNGLDETGRTQAIEIKRQLEAELRGKTVSFVSSPAKRCIETLKPLAESLSQPIDIVAILHDQQDGETAREFLERVNDFVGLWDECHSDAMVACTHGDVIPELTYVIADARATVAKGGYTKIERPESDGGPSIVSV